MFGARQPPNWPKPPMFPAPGSPGPHSKHSHVHCRIEIGWRITIGWRMIGCRIAHSLTHPAGAVDHTACCDRAAGPAAAAAPPPNALGNLSERLHVVLGDVNLGELVLQLGHPHLEGLLSLLVGLLLVGHGDPLACAAVPTDQGVSTQLSRISRGHNNVEGTVRPHCATRQAHPVAVPPPREIPDIALATAPSRCGPPEPMGGVRMKVKPIIVSITAIAALGLSGTAAAGGGGQRFKTVRVNFQPTDFPSARSHPCGRRRDLHPHVDGDCDSRPAISTAPPSRPMPLASLGTTPADACSGRSPARSRDAASAPFLYNGLRTSTAPRQERGTYVIVPGSGTGDLAGITGVMQQHAPAGRRRRRRCEVCSAARSTDQIDRESMSSTSSSNTVSMPVCAPMARRRAISSSSRRVPRWLADGAEQRPAPCRCSWRAPVPRAWSRHVGAIQLDERLEPRQDRGTELRRRARPHVLADRRPHEPQRVERPPELDVHRGEIADGTGRR